MTAPDPHPQYAQPQYAHPQYAQPQYAQPPHPQAVAQGYAQPGYPQQQGYGQPVFAQGPGMYTATFKAHTGLLIVALTSPKQVTGSMADVRRAFWGAQLHCLCLGWFGVISALVYNWVAIFGNISELNRVKTIAKQYGES